MSHIHLPDGVLPLWLWLGGALVAALLLGILLAVRRRQTAPRRFALLGVFAALMLLVMTIHLGVYHANLSIVAAIILGPTAGVLAAFIVNLLLAFLGHGGITVVGLNTLVMAVEMLAGAGIFHLLRRLRLPVAAAGLLAVVIGLALATAASFAIIAVAAPDINRKVQTAVVEHAHEHGHDSAIEIATSESRLNLPRLATVMLTVGAIGWLLEGILSAAILTMLQRMMPDLLTRKRELETHESL